MAKKSVTPAPIQKAGSELVIGLIGALGTNFTSVQGIIEARLRELNYKANVIRVSDFFRNFNLKTKLFENPEYQRIRSHMEAGNEIREALGNGNALARLSVLEIQSLRKQSLDKLEALPRYAHIIRSLKHADEVHAFRKIYGSGFFLIGVYSSKDRRTKFLTDRNIDKEKAEDLIKIDFKEENELGQQTSKGFHLADAFVNLDAPDKDEQINRVIDLLFGNPHISPDQDEHSMFLAFAASLRSADLSRQVGAAIISENGELLATGANDVPKHQGGQYWPGDGDQRDHVWGHDSNATEKNEIVDELVLKLSKIVPKKSSKKFSELARAAIAKTSLADLTEYGRPVHAEMEALISCARKGANVKGGKLFTTTYPCHNCARHIIASGIEEIVFIEPYPKSKALELHKDSLCFDEPSGKETLNRVRLKPFVGVGPRRYIDLFSMNLGSGRDIKRKVGTQAVKWKTSEAELRVPLSPNSYLELESSSTSKFFEIMEAKGLYAEKPKGKKK